MFSVFYNQCTRILFLTILFSFPSFAVEICPSTVYDERKSTILLIDVNLKCGKVNCPAKSLKYSADQIETTLTSWGAPFQVVVTDLHGLRRINLPSNGGNVRGNVFPVFIQSGTSQLHIRDYFMDPKNPTPLTEKPFFDKEVMAVTDKVAPPDMPKTVSNYPESNANLTSAFRYRVYPSEANFNSVQARKGLRLFGGFSVVSLDEAEDGVVRLGSILQYVMSGVNVPKMKNNPLRYDQDAFNRIQEKANKPTLSWFRKARKNEDYFRFYISGIILHELCHAFNWNSSVSQDHAGVPGACTEFPVAYSFAANTSDDRHSINGQLKDKNVFFNEFFSTNVNNPSLNPGSLSHIKAFRIRSCGKLDSCL